MVKKFRSAITGEYVKKSYADKNPNTTVGESDKPKPKGGGNGKNKK